MVTGYIRVSTDKQDIENQRNTILNYAFKKKIIIDNFIEKQISSRKEKSKRLIDKLMNSFNIDEDNIVIVTELSRIGRSVSEVTSIVNNLIEKNVRVISIKEAVDTKEGHNINTKVVITMFSLIAELERDLISLRTKEALEHKKAMGIKLGRPKGIGKSKIDKYKNEIVELLKKKVSISSISKIFNIKYSTLFKYIKRRNLKVI